MAEANANVGPSILLPERPVIAVIGAGSVGGYYGGRLARHGNDVHFLLRSDYDAVRMNGWEVRSCDGDFRLPPGAFGAYDDVKKMPPADLVLVTLKTTASDLYEPLVRPLLKPSSVILSVQNGLGPDEQLGELFGRERVLGGLAFVCINRDGPGRIHHIDHGMIKLGELGGGPSPRASQIASSLEASGIRCQVLPNLMRGRWEKLVWNVPFNGLGAALDLTTDRLLATETGRKWVTALMREVIAAAKANGCELPEDPERIIERQITATLSMGAYRSSMQIDRQERREMEIEAILGLPLSRARAAGLDVPYLAHLQGLTTMVSENTRQA